MRALGTCALTEQCGLCGKRVRGIGDDHEPTIMFIGEAPGELEERKGAPFVGKAGQELDRYLRQYTHVRRDVCYITNTVKCRYVKNDKNKTPTPHMVEVCTNQWLTVELAQVNPIIVATVGKVATVYMVGMDVKMERVHGIGFRKGSYVIVPVYHPAAALHQPRMSRFVVHDFDMLGKIVRGKGDVR